MERGPCLRTHRMDRRKQFGAAARVVHIIFNETINSPPKLHIQALRDLSYSNRTMLYPKTSSISLAISSEGDTLICSGSEITVSL